MHKPARSVTRVGACLIVAVVLVSTGGGCADGRAPGTRVERSVMAPADVRTELAARIERYLAVIERPELVRSVMVLVDGKTVYERYYQTSAQESHDIESVTKSVMSALVGIALAEGKLRSVDQTLVELLPDYVSGMTPAVAATTLRQVLTATAGFAGDAEDDFYEFAAARDWTKGVLASAVRPPGQAFGYSNGGAHLLSAILVEATGTSVLEYARAKLFDPLGIESRPALEVIPLGRERDRYLRAGFAWPVDPQGRHLGASLMKLKPADMAKLGVLHLNEGRWEGRQIVPAAWVHETTTNKLGALEANDGYADGYGYMWWTKAVGEDPAYLARGYGGQGIEVIPNRGLVIVTVCKVVPLNSDPDVTVLNPAELQHLTDSVIAPLFER